MLPPLPLLLLLPLLPLLLLLLLPLLLLRALLGGDARWACVWVPNHKLECLLHLLPQVPRHVRVHVGEHGRQGRLGHVCGSIQGLQNLQGHGAGLRV